MVCITCDNEECEEFGTPMDCTETDSRGEWTEETWQCSGCDRIKVHRTDYDQNGLVIGDKIEEVK